MAELNKILDDRAKTHGDFYDHARVAQTLKRALRASGVNSVHMREIHWESIDMILHKIARIMAGNPNEPDHWRDIAGYATIVLDRLPGERLYQEDRL